MDNVCDQFEAEVPKALLCNVHPLMFQRKVKEVFQLLHDTLGKDRIVDCFLVDVDFAGEDFITKVIRCLTSFINKDNFAKPWNRQKHFDSFESLSYKDHHFNRLFQCCMVLVHHTDDISSYHRTLRMCCKRRGISPVLCFVEQLVPTYSYFFFFTDVNSSSSSWN